MDQMRSTMQPTKPPQNTGAPGVMPPAPSQGSIPLPVQQPDAPGTSYVPPSPPASPKAPVPVSQPSDM